ncbi:MAG TPA: hypothetical protein DCE65_02965 [Clostridiales bacterium]|nr:hypothetical protein [Clostridiales bacterium]
MEKIKNATESLYFFLRVWYNYSVGIYNCRVCIRVCAGVRAQRRKRSLHKSEGGKTCKKYTVKK